MSLPLAVAAWGWSVVALFSAAAVAAIVAGRRRLTADPARRRRFWRAAALLVIVPSGVFAMITGIVVAQGIPSWDAATLRLVARHQPPAGHGIAGALTTTGGIPAVLALLGAALVVLLIARLYRQAAFVAAATLLSMATGGLMKLVFARARPAVVTHVPDSWSFPSGHTMRATGLAVALIIVFWPTRWRRPALVVATVYAAAVGLTRVYLGVHYPSDVAAGWALAVAVVGSTWLALWDPFEPAGAPAQDRGGKPRRARQVAAQDRGGRSRHARHAPGHVEDEERGRA